MNKRCFSIVLCLCMMLGFTACGNTTGSSSEGMKEPGASGPVPESTSASYKEYPSLARLADNLADTGLYLDIELPSMDITRTHVETTDELQSAALKILTESEARLQPDLLDDDSRDRTGDAVVIVIWGCDDGVYPNGDQLNFCALLPLGPNDPVAPNSTFLSVNNENYETDTYVYPADVYNQMLALFSDNVVETHADFEGGYVRMKLSQTEAYGIWGDTVECGYVLLHSRYANDDDHPYTKWQVEALDAVKGISFYQIESTSGSDRGALLRMSKLENIPDYDYCLFFEKGFAYRSSEDSTKEVYFALPSDVNPLREDSDRTAPYDEDDDSIVWIDSEGVHLYISKQDGITQKLILPNTELPTLFPDPDGYNGTLSYVSPRFICGGRKVVAAVYSDSQQQDVGVVVFDIATGKISSQLAYLPPTMAKYPVADRYVAVPYQYGQLLDAETGEIKMIPTSWVPNRSYDFQTAILMDYASLDARNAPAYVCDIDSPNDKSNPLLRPTEPRAWVNLADVTEHYAIFSVRDFDGDWLAATKYR